MYYFQGYIAMYQKKGLQLVSTGCLSNFDSGPSFPRSSSGGWNRPLGWLVSQQISCGSEATEATWEPSAHLWTCDGKRVEIPRSVFDRGVWWRSEVRWSAVLGSEEVKEGVGDGFGGDGGGRGGRQHAPHRPPEHGGQGRRGLQVTSNICLLWNSCCQWRCC